MSYKSEINLIENIEDLRVKCYSCRLCELCEERNSVVFGEGSNSAKAIFVGEAPGNREDIEGIPFVGMAGSLLNSLLEESYISRDDIFITNIVKCRPPMNVNPSTGQIKTCTIWLKKQLEIINPEFIVAIGNISMTTFIPSLSGGITKKHGMQLESAGGRTVIPMIHPAAAIRDSKYIKMIEEDLNKIRKMIYD